MRTFATAIVTEGDAERYVTPANLASRLSLYRYDSTPRPLRWRALDLAALGGGEAVVEVGCGNGRHLHALRERGHPGSVTGLDLSAGMVLAMHIPIRTATGRLWW